jgi:acyl-CoA hydrolase
MARCFLDRRAGAVVSIDHQPINMESAMHAASPALQYLEKTCTASAALDHVRDGDMIIVPTGVGEPPALLTALSDERQRFHDVRVAQILALRKFGYFDQASAHHVRHAALFSAAPRAPAARAAGATSSRTIFPNCLP